MTLENAVETCRGALLQGVTRKVSGIKDAKINHHAGCIKMQTVNCSFQDGQA